MKVILVIDSLAMGGAQKHLCQMAVGLSARGHHVHVVGLNDVCHPAMLKPLEEAGIRVTVIGRGAMLCGAGLFRLWWMLRSERPDILVTILFASTVAGRMAALLVKNVRVVTCVQARNINYRWWQFACLQLTASRTEAFFFNSRSAIPFGREHEGASAERSYYVANGIESPNDDSARNKAKWADFDLTFHAEDEVVATIGRLDPQKGYPDLLQAFAQIMRQRERAKLLLVGAGPQERRLRELAQELGLASRVVFAGERTNGAEIIALADLYVQPSVFEGTPNALMEAMAAGVPAIASAVDGAREIITEGVNGWLVPPGAPAMLAKAMTTVFEDKLQAATVGRQGRQTMLSGFAIERMLDDYEGHFLRLLGSPPKSTVKNTTMR